MRWTRNLGRAVKYLRLTLSHSEDTVHPMHRFANESDAVDDYRMLHWNATGEGTNALLFHVEGDRDVYESALEDAPSAANYAITAVDDRSFYVHVEDATASTGEKLVEALSQDGVVVASPLEYLAGGRVQFTLVGESAALRRAVDEIPDSIGVELERAGEYDGRAVSSGVLSDRQREALSVAVEVGYYEVPREGSVEDVAERLGCSTGTASEHLRKAESKLVLQAVDR